MRAARGIACTDARGITFKNVRVNADASPVVELTDCDHVVLDSVFIPSHADPFLHVSGARSDGIVIMNSPVQSAKTAIRLGTETSRQAVSVKN